MSLQAYMLYQEELLMSTEYMEFYSAFHVNQIKLKAKQHFSARTNENAFFQFGMKFTL